ncbi:MAG: ATP-grasp domain-containing protein [Chlamydiota bacterium]
MQIHEFQAKNLLKEIGIEVAPFQVIASLEELAPALKILGEGPFLMKPQIHGPRPGLIGQNREECASIIQSLLGASYEDQIAHRILITTSRSVEKEEKLVWTLEKSPEHPLALILDKFFVDHDLTRMELHLGTIEERVHLIEAFLFADDKALYRQPALISCFDSSQMSAKALYAAHYGFSYTEYEGRIGCLFSGNGAGQKIQQLTEKLGGSISATVDLRGIESREVLEGALKLLSKNSRSILVSLFPEIMNMEVWACWLLASLEGIKTPIIVRLLGEKKDLAKALLAKYPRIYAIDDAEEAVRTAIIKAGLL